MADATAVPASSKRRLSQAVPPFAALFAVGLGYFTGSYGSHLLALDTNQIAFFWPSGAVLLAALLLSRREQWPVYAVAALLCGLAADFLAGSSAGSPILVTPLNVFEVAGVAMVLRRWDAAAPSFATLSGIVKFIVAVVCGAALTAIVGTVVIDRVTEANFLAQWTTWFAADALGMLLVTPFILIVSKLRDRRTALPERLRAEGVWLFGAVALVSLIAFRTDTAPIAFLAVPFVLLATLRLGPLGATVSTLIVTVVAVAMTAFGHGPLNLVSGGLIARVQYLQLYLAVIFVTTLPLSGLLAERERLVARVMESEDSYKRLVGSVSDVIYQTDLEGRWTFLNTAWENLTGRKREDTIGRNFVSSVHEADRAGLIAAIAAVSDSGEEQLTREARFTDANGRTRWAELRATVLRDRAGRVTGSSGTLTDITERRVAEQALTESESLYRLLAENISDTILRLGVDGRCLYASPSAVELSGRPADELIGRYITDFVEPEDRERVRETHFAVVSTPGSSGTVRYRYHHPDGRLLWLETNTRSVADADGHVVEVISAIRDISPSKALEDELVAARDSAQAAAEAKSNFLANMSHEIRTPMNGVLGFAEVLAKADLTPDQHHYASVIVTSGRSLMRLLDDILDMSKIDAGGLEVVIESFDLPELLTQCGALFEPTAEAKGLDLRVEFGDLPRFARSDPHRLRQILLNLLGNAVKFTATGHVSLRATMNDAANLRIDVTDSGIGIPVERQAAIFNEFEQEDASTSRRYGGTGLGLSISRRLAGLLGGTLELASEPGKGTTVTLTVPVEPGEALPAQSAATASQQRSAPANILLAEDVEINRDLVETLLIRAGHRLRAVPDGAQAIAAVEADDYDLVLMDVQMPEVDGLEATRAIRAKGGRFANLPIIALTANALRPEIDACLAAGMTDHVVKPIEEARLLAAIDRAMAGRTEDIAAASPTLPPALLDKFRVQCLEAAEALEHVVSSNDSAEIVAICHKLTGVASVFGYADLGDAARDLEVAVKCDGVTEQAATDTRALAARLREVAVPA